MKPEDEIEYFQTILAALDARALRLEQDIKNAIAALTTLRGRLRDGEHIQEGD